MKDKDQIKELFSEKLRNHEVKVDPQVWAGISSKLGVIGTTTATGISVITKWIIGVSAAAVVTTTVVMLSNTEVEPAPKEIQIVEDNSNILEQSVEEEQDKAEQTIIPNEAQETSLQEETTINSQTELTNTPAIVNTTSPEVINNNNQRTAEQNEKLDPPLVVQPLIVDPYAEEVDFIEEIEEEIIEMEDKKYSIQRLPNIITPNGDRVNDELIIQSTGLTGFHILVLNEQGQVVYESSDPSFSWDGTDKTGAPVKEGNYVYVITANEFETDKPKRYSPLRVIR